MLCTELLLLPSPSRTSIPGGWEGLSRTGFLFPPFLPDAVRDVSGPRHPHYAVLDQDWAAAKVRIGVMAVPWAGRQAGRRRRTRACALLALLECGRPQRSRRGI